MAIDIFTAPAILTAGGFEVWAAVSSDDADYGGCEVLASYDAQSYQRIATLYGNSRHGVAVNNIPFGGDTDEASILRVLMNTGDAQLINGTQADVDGLATLCLLGDELIAYRDASLVASRTYDLSYLRRGVYGTEQAANTTMLEANAIATGADIAAPDVYGKGDVSWMASGSTTSGIGAASGVIQGSHDGIVWLDVARWSLALGTTPSAVAGGIPDYFPFLRGVCQSISGTGSGITITASFPVSGQRFVRLDNQIIKHAIAPELVGSTMYFKFRAFNRWGAGLQSLADVNPYSYAIEPPLGAPAAPSGLSMTQAGAGLPVRIDFTASTTSNVRWHELRYLPAGSVPNWDNGTIAIAAVLSHPFDTLTLPVGNYLWMLAAEDTGAKYSAFDTLTFAVL